MFFVFFITACTDGTDQQTEQDNELEESLENEETWDANEPEKEGEIEETGKIVEPDERKTIAQNLQEPWEIALVEDTIYISERNGAIVTVNDVDQKRKPVQLDQDLSDQPEAGLLGIAFPDDFEKTKTAFAYYSYQEDGAFYQRVITIEESREQWEETAILLDKIPGGQYHQGGRIEIGPDDKIYITTGDATVPELSQDLDSLAGKILRMNLDGSIPEDNPFDDSYVYSYGHRNPQGLAWGPNNEFYATEHGSNAFDEVNLIKPGKNYGWPVIRGDETASEMELPIIHSGEETWAPSGMTYLSGNFYFASLRGEGLRKFDPMNETQDVIISDAGRVRDALATEEGIYIITNNTDGRGNSAENDDQLIYIPIPKNQLQ